MSRILLITPPFLQLNNPYPAMPYLKGFLAARGFDVEHFDLSIETAREIYSSEFLKKVHEHALHRKIPEPFNGFYSGIDRYISTIDPVIEFLSGRNRTLAHRIVAGNFLPEGPRFSGGSEDSSFSPFDTTDRARYLATLYIEDISDAYRHLIDPEFGITRYRESTGVSAAEFADIEKALSGRQTEIEKTFISLLDKKLKAGKTELAVFTIPFPGNLFSALRCAQFIKEKYPDMAVAAGGGFVNTELREIGSTDFFSYMDYLLFDDGEYPLEKLIMFMNGKATEKELVNCIYCREGEVIRSEFRKSLVTEEIYSPDYSDTDPDRYISMFDTTNPMMRLWNDGYWNKLTLAHGCYWSGCTFCDTSLDYIGNFRQFSVEAIISKMKAAIESTCESGFHFTDEAAPPALLKKLALAILKERIICTWWTNIRFEEAYTPDLAKLLALSGCIALSGGVEAASPRILKLINKGVSVETIARSAYNLSAAGILVHGYLMYGYPTQTEEETVASLETVRQLFAYGCIDSGYWHRFTLTCHSEVYRNYSDYGITLHEKAGDFARNDIAFTDPAGIDHERFHNPLNMALSAYMEGEGLDRPVEKWFGKGYKAPSVKPDLIESAINTMPAESGSLFFIAAIPEFYYEKKRCYLTFRYNGEDYSIDTENKESNALKDFYEKYTLYSVAPIEKVIEDLSGFLVESYDNVKKSELYSFLREFSFYIV